MRDELRDEIADVISKPRWSAELLGGNEQLADALVAVVARERAAAKAEQREADAVIVLGDVVACPIPEDCANPRCVAADRIRAAGTETGETP